MSPYPSALMHPVQTWQPFSSTRCRVAIASAGRSLSSREGDGSIPVRNHL